METLLQDLAYGLRMLYKRPGFTFLVILILMLGIGANTAIFSVMNGVLFRPLPYANPDRLVMIWQENKQQDKHEEPTSPANFLDWQQRNTVFEHMSAFREWSFNVLNNGSPLRVDGAVVSRDFFDTLGSRPALGNTFQPDDGQNGGGRSLVVSYNFWQKQYGGSANIIGAKLILNEELYMVIGVMPADFDFPQDAALWVPSRQVVPESPVSEVADVRTVRDNQYLQVIARLKAGASLENARANFATISGNLAEQYPESNGGWEARIIPLRDQIVGAIESSLWVLFAAVGFVLLITCANVANLLLARASDRHREFSIRLALGASRARLIRQLLTESVLLAFIGGLLALLLAQWGVQLLIAINPYYIPRIEQVGLDVNVWAFVSIISLLTGVVLGLAPAVSSLKADLSETLKESSRGSTSTFSRFRSVLVVCEISLALILLIGAGLMVKSLTRVMTVDPGFSPDNVLTMQVSLPKTKYKTAEDQAAFFKQVLDKARTAPGIESVGAISRLPLSGGSSSRSFTIPGRTPISPGQENTAIFFAVSPDYFQTMRIALLSGRAFTDSDLQTSPPIAIINETLAHSMWPDQNPIGQHLSFEFEKPTTREVVGVVKGVRYFGLDADLKPEIYVPYLQNPWAFMTVVARTPSHPAGVAKVIQNQIAGVDKDQPVSQVKTMDEVLALSIAPRRFNMLLLSIFAVLSLVLACVGIYGVMSYLVILRTREIGVRLALGAQPRDIIELILRRGLTHIVLGIGIGLVGALILTRFLVSLLFSTAATDVTTFLIIPLILGAVALLACFIPAYRASRIDPLVAMRNE